MATDPYAGIAQEEDPYAGLAVEDDPYAGIAQPEEFARSTPGEVAANLGREAMRGTLAIPEGIIRLGQMETRQPAAVRVANAVVNPAAMAREVNRFVLPGAEQAVADFLARRREDWIGILPPDPARGENLATQKVPSAVGSSIPFIVGSMAGLPVSVSGVSQGVVEGRDDAVAHNATPDQVDIAMAAGGALGATEALGLGRTGQMVRRIMGGERRLAGHVVQQVIEEAIQNPAQQLGQNVVAADVAGYDPSRPRSRGVGEAALVGALAAGGVSVGVGGAANLAAGQPPITLDDAQVAMSTQYGRDKVRRVDDNTLHVSLPDGRGVAVAMRPERSAVLAASDDTALIESVKEANPRAVERAQAQARAAGSATDETVAGLLRKAGMTPVAATSTSNLPVITDPISGVSLKTDALIELVSGEATAGRLAHEDLHALIRLAGVKPTEVDTLGGEEKLAYALDRGVSHPVLQKVRDFIHDASQMLRKDKTRSAFREAVALRDRLRGQVAAVPEPGSGQDAVRAALQARMARVGLLDPRLVADPASADRPPAGAVPALGTMDEANLQTLEALKTRLQPREGRGPVPVHTQDEAGSTPAPATSVSPAPANPPAAASGTTTGEPLPVSPLSAQSAVPPPAPAYAAAPEGQRMRQTIERLRSGDWSAELKARFDADARSYIDPQSLQDVEQRAATLSEGEQERYLAQFDTLAEHQSADNMAVAVAARRLEQLRASDPQAAFEFAQRVARNASGLGQLLRQMAMVKGATPENAVYLVESAASRAGRRVSPSERARLLAAATQDFTARQALRSAEAAYFDQPTAVNLRLAEQAHDAARRASTRMQQESQPILPKGWAEMFRYQMQGNALTTSSQVANIIGNIALNPVRGVAQTIASTAEGVLSVLTGGKVRRTVGNPYADLRAYGEGFGQGAALAPSIIRTGVNPLTATAGEVRKGFQPIHAWIRQLQSLANSEKVGVNERLKLLFEGVFGVPSEAMFRMLAVGDAPFYQAAETSALNEIGRLSGLTGQALEAFVRLPTPEAKRIASERAKEAVFQGDNLLARAMVGMANAGKGQGVAGEWLNTLVARPVLLFAKTPANLAWEADRFLNPAHGLAGMIFHGVRGNQREAFMSFGRMMTSLALWSGAAAMHAAGLVRGGLDRDEKERDLAFVTGLKPRHFNLTGLGRLLAGDNPALRPGDQQIDYRNLGVIGMALGLYADGIRPFQQRAAIEGRRFDASSVSKVAVGLESLGSLPSALLDMTMMRGAYNVLDALKNKKWDQFIGQYFNTVSGIALPNSLATLGRSLSGYMPDYRVRPDDVGTWANIQAGARTAVNMQAGKLWALDELVRRAKGGDPAIRTIPLKRDLYGRPIPQTPAGRNPYVYHLIDVLKLHEIPQDVYGAEIDRIFRATGNKAVIPGEVKLDPKTATKYGLPPFLTARQQERFEEIVGYYRTNGTASMMAAPGWTTLPADQQSEAIERVNRDALEYGRYWLARELPTMKALE